MNSPLSLLLGLLTLAAPAITRGITLPVSEDGYATNTKKDTVPRITAATGTAATLRLANTTAPAIRFEAGSLAADYPAPEVSRALLMVYFTKVTKPGDIGVCTVTTDWTEAPSGTPAAFAIQPIPIATIPAASVIARQFAIIDVTDQVKSWLTTPATDFGFAFTTTGSTSAEIGAKEGPSAGYPAVLQIERIPVIADADLPTGIDASKLGTGTITNTEFSYLDGVTSPLQPQIATLGEGLSSLSANLPSKINRIGDTMTGPLFLPSNGLRVGTNQLRVANNKVGIGTSTPTAALEVHGDIKLGTYGNLLATSSDENLHIVRGSIRNVNGVLTAVRGLGYSVSSSGSDSTITFDMGFSEPPVITVSQEKAADDTPGNAEVYVKNVTVAGAVITTYTETAGITYNFIAIGPREAAP